MIEKRISDIKGAFRLHNGVDMPYLGLGVYQTEDGPAVVNAVQWALETGYRHIDTASIYQNERGVGWAIRNSPVSRDEIFVVSKVWNSDQGYESTLKAFDASLNRLGLEYLDLFLIHWPVKGRFRDTWKALEFLYSEKKVRAIGVSNFLQHHLESLLEVAEVVPMVNQMEFHPFLVQEGLLQFCAERNIQYEAWSPLMQGHIFQHAVFEEIAEKYGKSVAQIALRWNLEKGVVTIPKSGRKEHIQSNAALFDFSLSQEDIRFLEGLDRNQRFGPDPDTFEF